MAERVQASQEQIEELDRINKTSHSLPKTIDQPREWGIIKSSISYVCENKDCESFQLQISWIKDNSKVDLGRFRCTSCNQGRSHRHQSVFQNLKLDLLKLFRLVFVCFIKKQPIKQASSDLKIERHTITRIYRILHSQIAAYNLNQNSKLPLGTQPIEEFDESNQMQVQRLYSPAVEADESLFTHLCNTEGVYKSQCWVIGVVDRLTSDFRIKAVGTDRSTETIQAFFKENVATNPSFLSLKTRVYTDGYLGYSFLKSIGFDHYVVTHKKGFGSGINTTNHIESLWSQLKRLGSFNNGQQYQSIEDVQMCLEENYWRVYCDRNKQDLITSLAHILKINYRM